MSYGKSNQSIYPDVQKGDLVALKGGGPPMTVKLVEAPGGLRKHGGVVCVWFEGCVSREELFDVDVLERYPVGRAARTVERARRSG